jgi:hypothetical protein
VKQAAEKRSCPLGDLDIDMAVEYTKRGTPQDDQLRREQAKAIFDLVACDKNRPRKGRDEDAE